jgi:hypothetical protein
MKLSEYIENKKVELVAVNKFKSVEFKRLDNCQVSQFMHSCILDFTDTKIDTSIEVEEFDRTKLGNTKIDCIEITFNVVKPRCRKPESLRTYVKIS